MATPENQEGVPPGSAVPADPTATQAANTPPSSGGTTQQATSDTVTDDNGTPSLDSLQNDRCPNCHTGVLYVTRYDPDALHEVGQDLSAANQQASGGAYQVYCFNCTYSESRAFGTEGSATNG